MWYNAILLHQETQFILWDYEFYVLPIVCIMIPWSFSFLFG